MLPLAGIELLALVVGLYCACWKMNFRQLIQIAPHKLSLTDGHYHPRRRWELDIGGRRSRPPQDSARLTLHDRQHRITLGAFLNKEDSEILLKLLWIAACGCAATT